jgi:REJ domain.
VETECVTCKAYKTFKYISTNEMKIRTRCPNCPASGVTVDWEIRGNKDDRVVPLNENTVKSPLQSEVLVLAENILDGLQSYEVTVTVTVACKISFVKIF